MSGHFTLSQQARTDLHEVAAFLADQGLERGERFYDAAWAAFARVAATPEIGRRCGFTEPDLADLRWWPIRGFRSYLVFYKLAGDGVFIVRLMHGARDLPTHLPRP